MIEVKRLNGQYYVFHTDDEGHILTGIESREGYDAWVWGYVVYYEL